MAKGIDLIIMRELTGGVYFGEHRTDTLPSGEKQAVDQMPYSEQEIRRIGRIGFETARQRRKSSAVWIKPTYWTPAVCGGL